MTNKYPISIKDFHKNLKDKKFSVLEATQDFLLRASEVQQETNSFTEITKDLAVEKAKVADQLIEKGKDSFLTGLPFVMKDVYQVEGTHTTAASNVLRNYSSQYSSTVYSKLENLGGVLIGKNNQDAWGHGGSSENTDFGPVKNPWDTKRVAGGSGGGTAASVAAGAAIYGIGEDTGGSIRNPAAYCGITGLKVTYGRVSRYGAIAYASSFDTMGPTARSAEDIAYILEVIAGYDRHDASSSREIVPNYSKLLGRSLKGKVIGIIPELMGKGIKEDVETSMQEALKEFVKLGAAIKEVHLPTAAKGHSIYYILALSETSSNLARYTGIRYGSARENFSSETKRRIMTGSFALSSGYYDAYYKKALQARTLLINEFNQAYEEVDFIATPVMPFAPYLIGDIASQFDSDSYAVAMYLADIYTCLANIVGVPSIAFPTGFNKDNLPLSLQLHGKMFAESELLNIVHQYQLVTDWHTRTPNL